jgi:hypothetical protein
MCPLHRAESRRFLAQNGAFGTTWIKKIRERCDRFANDGRARPKYRITIYLARPAALSDLHRATPWATALAD